MGFSMNASHFFFESRFQLKISQLFEEFLPVSITRSKADRHLAYFDLFLAVCIPHPKLIFFSSSRFRYIHLQDTASVP